MKTSCSAKEARHKGSHNEGFYFYETSRTGKFTEPESRFVAARGWGVPTEPTQKRLRRSLGVQLEKKERP